MTRAKRTRTRKADKLLAAGKLTEAIVLYRKKEAWDGLMRAYERLGDLKSAAEAATKANLPEESARLFEKAGMLEQAAEMWLRTDRKERAAVVLEKAGDSEAAAELYLGIEMPSRAAAALAAAGRHGEAGKLYEQAAETEKALQMYELAGQVEDVGRILEQQGDFAGAARAYRKAGDARKAAELFARSDRSAESAQCYVELGEYRKAGDLLLACDHPLEAAEAYALEAGTLEKAAEIMCRALRSRVVWQVDAQGPIACLGVSEDGGVIAVGAARKLRVFNEHGDLMWRFVPGWGGNPRCLAVSAAGSVILGCDDGHLYSLTGDKTLVWVHDLSSNPMKVSTSSSGECIACCTEGHSVLCLDQDHNLKWRHNADNILWDVAVSPDGKVIAVGTADGSCILFNEDGERIATYRTRKWVHSVCVQNDATFALGTGMREIELVDGANAKRLWSLQEASPVHNVVLTSGKSVLSVADGEAVLRDQDAAVLWRHSSDDRLLGGQIHEERRMAVLRCVGRKLVAVALDSCRAQAASCYKEAGNYQRAAALYEQIEDHEAAAVMFKKAHDYVSAARNSELGGSRREAAELYEQAEDFQRAARLFKDLGDLERSAECYVRAGDSLKAAESFEQAGAPDRAAELYEQAEQYGKAGLLYKAAGSTPEATRALSEHVTRHADDWEKRFELGLLLQEDGQYDAAIEHFQVTAESEELRRKAVTHVAECFTEKGMYDIAIERYKACLDRDEKVSWNNRHIFYGLGRAYQLAGDYREARRTYEGILAVDFRYKDVQSLLEDVRKLSSVFQQGTTVAASVDRTVVADQAFQLMSAEKRQRYIPVRKLGSGGMGTVYLAEDRRLNRKVALKMLPASLRSDEQMRLRIIHEAQSIAQITHPNVVAVFDVGEEQGSCYVSMEFVEGQTLADVLEQKGRLEPEECVQLLIPITDGLGYAHSKGILHRDVKPLNIMLTADGVPKIMDFGLALIEGATRLTMPGAASSTPLYMAPEQLRGEPDLTPAVDIYAIGCLAYELLTGKPPFSEGNIGIQHLSQAPKSLRQVNPEIPAELDEVIAKCLAKDPLERYPNGSSLNDALRQVERTLS